MTNDAVTPALDRQLRPGRAQAASQPPSPVAKVLRKLLVELGPLLGFFIVYNRGGIFWATGIFMALTALAVVPSWWRRERPPLVPLISLALVLALGALTLLLGDESYVTVRPTVINLLFAGGLSYGLVTGRPLLRRALGDVIDLTETGWRGLTLRLVLFLVGLAVLNEIVRHTQPLDLWVAFKTFAVLPLDLAFVGAMWPYALRHRADGR